MALPVHAGLRRQERERVRGGEAARQSPQSTGAAAMTKPGTSKQHKSVGVLGYLEAIAHGDGSRCWCDLGFKSLQDAPADLPMHFCNPFCKHEWLTCQPLQDLLDERRIKREHGGQ